jgi:hypothetical protein
MSSQFMVAGLLAFAFLDRLTGSWSVNDMDWFVKIRDLILKDNALVWWAVSMVRERVAHGIKG